MPVLAMFGGQLARIQPQLAAFVNSGGTLRAAFSGDGGVFVVYSPHSRIPGPPLFYLCTMRDRPALIDTADETANWVARDIGTAVARALAEGVIAVKTRGATLYVADADADRALENAKKPVDWMPE